MSKARFARSGITHPLGKFTALFPRFKGPEATKEILERRATELGMSLAEYVREMCIVNAHGEQEVRNLQARRIAVVAGTGPETNKNQ